MTIELTEEQQKLVSATAHELTFVHNPRTHIEYVLIPVQEYEVLAADEEDRREQEAILRMSMRNAAARMEEEP